MKKLLLLFGLFIIPAFAECASGDIYIHDLFTVGADTNLEDHTPTEVGTGWTELITIGGGSLYVESDTDTIKADGGGLGDGVLYTAQGTYNTENYSVCVNIAGTIESGDDPYVLAARVQNSNNMYIARFSDDTLSFHRKYDGTWYDLGSEKTGQDYFSAAGDEACFQVSGTGGSVVVNFKVNGVSKYTVINTSNPIYAIGEAGYGVGNIGVNDSDDTDDQEADNFLVREINICTARISAGAGTDDDSTGTLAWSNPGNIIANDGSDATAVTAGANAQTHYLIADQFSYSFSNVTIGGVLVGINRACDNNSANVNCVDNTVSLVKGGAVSGDNKGKTSTEWPVSDGTAVYGGMENTWGLALTESDVEAGNFGVALSADITRDSTEDPTAYVDWIYTIICYDQGTAAAAEEDVSRNFFHSFPF